MEVVELVFWLHCVVLGIVHVEDGLLERLGIADYTNLESLEGMFRLPDVGVRCSINLLRDGCVASETIFVENLLGH